MLVCVIFVLAFNIIFYFVCWKFEFKDYESHVSCVVGLLSLFITGWVAYWANSLDKKVHNEIAFQGLLEMDKTFEKDVNNVFAVKPIKLSAAFTLCENYEFALRTMRGIDGKLEDELQKGRDDIAQVIKDAKKNQKEELDVSRNITQLHNIVLLIKNIYH